ncbi:hypothetical protein G7Y89_g11289 [Cudoniella acicularis]|uniref:Zn(2)-C6 fungal-type domain-containing protein n=1 Tax=Cudoniella acicularis TaxID=354080 RepID=A0A8H4RDY1_9HELO|nr:hypothetical protein G7Y89_g11289 [Cudoniella acicularis]
MVATRPYYDDEEPSFRRYSQHRGGHGYPISHDRELPPAPGPYHGPREHISAHETRNGHHSSDQDNNARPRSRIPVACGRCRKRKIRCSGDLGTGLPCTNCKSAGVENCQFLRVSSQEAPLKHDPVNFDSFDPPSAAPRLQCRLVPYGPHAYMTPNTPTTTNEYYSRGNSVTSYQMPGRYYGIPHFSEFGEEGVEYGLTTYNLLGTEHLLPTGLAPSSTTRGWTPTPQLPKSGPLYMEQEPTYSHGQLPYHPAYQLRPTISPETKTTSLNGQSVNSSLPPPITGTDRVLPFPAARTPQVGSYNRPSSTAIPITQAGYHSYDGLWTSNSINASKQVNNTPASDNNSVSSSYLSYSSSSPESLSSSHTAYTSQAMSQQSSEMYTPTSDNLFHPNDSSDSSYGPSSGEKRPSHSSQAGTLEGSIPSLSSGNLANGHAYIPYNSQSSYPAPPMDMPAPTSARRVSTGISAA